MIPDFDDIPTKHTLLPYCWVCLRRFDPNLLEEQHHIIPKAYGGMNGPLVSLCSDHHTALHEVGKRIYAKKPFYDLLSKDPVQDKKLVYLGTIACNARIATENDPNRRQMIVLSLSKDHKRMLKSLKKVYRGKSQPSIFELALEHLYDRHFAKRP